ncbi:MAG: ATP synthase F1 subunit delta [Alphaproteobacteria bacterium]|nr:ATP synthase F1 subunit delta [Alphaproteobacteria bacterium]
MKNSGEIQIASRYVSALFDVASAASALVPVEKDMHDLARAAKSDKGFADFLASPLLGAKQQAQVVAALADSFAAHAVTKAFLVTLAQAKRLDLIAEISRQFAKKAEEARGELSAEMVTAKPAGKEEMALVAEHLGKATGKKINLTSAQDPKLLGGVMVKIGSVQLDASLAGKLQRLEHTLKAA